MPWMHFESGQNQVLIGAFVRIHPFGSICTLSELQTHIRVHWFQTIMYVAGDPLGLPQESLGVTLGTLLADAVYTRWLLRAFRPYIYNTTTSNNNHGYLNNKINQSLDT